MCYYSLSCYPIDFKPWHKYNDSYVWGRCTMTFLSHTSCSSGLDQDFLDHYVDQCRHIDVNTPEAHCRELETGQIEVLMKKQNFEKK